jgi:rhodanese-related sulfurtransferase
MKKKMFVLVSIIVLMLVSSGVSVNALITRDKQILDTATNIGVPQNQNLGRNTTVIWITVYEAWELLTNTSNGIQKPIDVRTDEEWNASFIDTPYPECPIHYRLDLFHNETWLWGFLEMYDGKEILLYSKTNSGPRFTQLLIELLAIFNGTIYSMAGGITTWIEAGLPVRQDTAPDTPTITGITKGRPGDIYQYTTVTIDPEGDNVYYCWGDDTGISPWFGPYGSGEEVIFFDCWNKMGTYIIMVKAKDVYGAESDWGYLEVVIPLNLQITKSSQQYSNNQNLLDSLLLQQMVKTNK